MNKTKIEWTDTTWNPIRGCSRVSEGCTRCYAERVASRFSGKGWPYEGLITRKKWNGKVRFIEKHLDAPLSWTKPRKVFVNSMSDLFHENVETRWIDKIFAVMAISNFERFRCRRRNCDHDNEECDTAKENATAYPTHAFQVLTKRPARMRIYLTEEFVQQRICDEIQTMGYGEWLGFEDFKWPLPNVWLGVSVENQYTANERVPILLKTPAAIRWISAEPLLGPLDISQVRVKWPIGNPPPIERGLDWVVVGGESGPGARDFDVNWANNLIGQCQDADIPIFVKQLGRKPYRPIPTDRGKIYYSEFKDRKGGDMSEWPDQLRVREFPKIQEVVAA